MILLADPPRAMRAMPQMRAEDIKVATVMCSASLIAAGFSLNDCICMMKLVVQWC